MATIINSPEVPKQELRDHEEAFHSFTKLVLFAVLHVILVLVSLALAFVGHMPVLALLLGLGGTLALLGAFAVAA